MSLEALFFQVLCILTVVAFVLARIEGNKKPAPGCTREQATRNAPTSITK
jgi:hypothetical protein